MGTHVLHAPAKEGVHFFVQGSVELDASAFVVLEQDVGFDIVHIAGEVNGHVFGQ